MTSNAYKRIVLLCYTKSKRGAQCVLLRVKKGSRVQSRVSVTVFYQQIENDNKANQIHGFTIDYEKTYTM